MSQAIRSFIFDGKYVTVDKVTISGNELTGKEILFEETGINGGYFVYVPSQGGYQYVGIVKHKAYIRKNGSIYTFEGTERTRPLHITKCWVLK